MSVVSAGAVAGTATARPRARRVSRTDITVPSGRDVCAAWLYRPDVDSGCRLPTVVLGHGLGCVREMRLDAFAQRFAEAGYQALAFDYRHFGASTGTPRQLLDIPSQLADWRAAVAAARALPDADPRSIVLFGTSFSGGHVLEVAAADPDIVAVISQCPFTSGPASAATLGLAAPGAGLLGVGDLVGAAIDAPPTMMPIVTRPGGVALLNAPDALAGYRSITPPRSRFVNSVPARAATQILAYSPGAAVGAIRAPVIFGICDRDSVAPAGPSMAYASTARRAVVRRYPVGHFDVYLGRSFDRAVGDYLAFLRRHVPITS